MRLTSGDTRVILPLVPRSNLPAAPGVNCPVQGRKHMELNLWV